MNMLSRKYILSIEIHLNGVKAEHAHKKED
jgi:hypothetical protein